MRPKLVASLARKFIKSRSLALSTIVPFTTAVVVVAMFVVMKAFTLSGEQVVDRDLGRFSNALDMSRVAVSSPPGDDRLPEAVVAASQSTGVTDAVISLTSFDVRPDMPRPPLVLYVETDWSASPFPRRFSLDQGRWPERAGEVVLTSSLRAEVGEVSSITALSGNVRFEVVGVATDNFDSFSRILAAPGTWRSFGEATRRNFSTVSASSTLYFNGAPDPVLSRMTNLMTDGDFPSELSEREIRSQLADGLRTRANELTTDPRSWVERIPFAYQVPSLGLPLLAVLSVLGLNGRRFRVNVMILISVGVTRPIATAGVALAASFWTIVSTLGGLLVGVGLGAVARPVCDYFLAGPISPFPDVTPPALRLIGITAVTCMVAGLALIVAYREPRAETNPVGGTVDSSPRKSRLRNSARRVVINSITPVRRFAALVAGLSIVAQAAVLESAATAMIMAGSFGVVILLLIPDLVPAAIRRLPATGPRARLSKRQLVVDTGRAVAGVAVLSAALGVPLGMLTLLATLISTAQADSTPVVAPQQVVLSAPGGAFHPPSREVVDAVTRKISFSEPAIRTGYLSTDNVKVTVEGSARTLLVVDTPDAAARLNNAPLGAEHVDTLRDGGVLVWEGEEQGQRALLVQDATSGEIIVSRTPPLPVRRIDFQEPWNQPTSGLILTATARRLGLEVAEAAVVLTGVTDKEALRAEQAVIDSGLDPYQVGIYEPPEPVRVPPVYYTAALGLALVVLVTSMAVARTQVSALRGYVGRLIAVGLSRRWVRQVLLLQSCVVVGMSTVLGLVIAVLPVLVAVQRLPNFVLSIPWRWLGIVLVAFYAATTAATLLSSRRLRATDRLVT